MYDGCPEINGWAFWSWKRAPTKHPGLATIKLPKDWERVMAWVASLLGGGQPDPATIRAGIRTFIEAMKLKNCEYDQRMQQALLPKR